MSARPRPVLAEEIARGIVRVKKRLIAEADRRLAERGEGVLAFQVLNALRRCGPCAQNELAQEVGQHPTGLSRLLDELDQGGMVERERDPSDRRKLVVQLTSRGRSFLTEHQPLVDAAVEHVLAPLAAAERRTLRELLWRMLEQ
jgi:DNA-binding MarR family transcriptional regulator